jgi:hypothetical protein
MSSFAEVAIIPNWSHNDLGGLTRVDGAMVSPRLTMWGASGPADFGEIVSMKGKPRRWKTAQAALLTVEIMFPVPVPVPASATAPRKPLDSVAARVVAEMAGPRQERHRNVRETVAALIAAIRGRSMAAFVLTGKGC